MRRSVGDQRDEISLKGDYEFKENKNRENGQGEKKEQAVEKREDVDHREDVDYHRARTKMSSQSFRNSLDTSTTFNFYTC